MTVFKENTLNDVPGGTEKAFTVVDGTPLERTLQEFLSELDRNPHTLGWRRISYDLLENLEGCRILEAGCGVGGAARDLAARVGPAGSVTAVDKSVSMVKYAEKHHDLSLPVQYEVADITDLPIADGFFDGVRCERVLHHVPEADIALAELVRVIRPGGKICVVEPDFLSLVIDLPDSRMVGEIVEHSANFVTHPDMGRSLRRRMTNAGVPDVAVHTVCLSYTSLPEAAVLIPELNEDLPVATDAIPHHLRDAWFSALKEADRADTFYCSMQLMIGCGVKR